MRKLFLDDSRNPPDFTWDVVKSYDQFVAYIQLHGVPDVISFDHDLGKEHYEHYAAFIGVEDEATDIRIPYESFVEKTGYDCAKWLVENYRLPPSYRIHSMNPVGAQNIKFVLDAANRRERENDRS